MFQEYIQFTQRMYYTFFNQVVYENQIKQTKRKGYKVYFIFRNETYILNGTEYDILREIYQGKLTSTFYIAQTQTALIQSIATHRPAVIDNYIEKVRHIDHTLLTHIRLHDPGHLSRAGILIGNNLTYWLEKEKIVDYTKKEKAYINKKDSINHYKVMMHNFDIARIDYAFINDNRVHIKNQDLANQIIKKYGWLTKAQFEKDISKITSPALLKTVKKQKI